MSNKFRYAFFISHSTFSHTSYPTKNAISSSGFSLFHQYLYSTPSKSSLLSNFTTGSFSFSQSAINSIASDRYTNQYSSSSRVETTTNLIENEVSNVNIDSMIVNVIKSNGKSMEINLNSFVSKLSKSFVIAILIELNSSKMTSLRFFDWLKNALPSYCRNADICSLVFANCGLLGDYDAMINLLKLFRDQQICLSEKAFGFLPISSIDVDTAKKSIAEIVRLLSEVGGSCCNSGLHSLVQMLCSLGSIELARYVIQISERRVSFYCILVKHMCSRNQFEDARNLLEEMRQIGCEPDSKTYNHLISYLCNLGRIDEALLLLQEMLNRGCSPDMLTFEILIHFSCRYGCLDKADMLFNQMVSGGLKPRLSTHYAYIRGCFRSQQFEEAYIYVKITAAKDKSVEQDIYNLLANLHVKHGDLRVGYDLIAEMLGKGLRPKHSMFIRATKHLYQCGEANFAERLKAQYVKLNDEKKSNNNASQRSPHIIQDWREFRATLFSCEQSGDSGNHGHDGLNVESKPLSMKWAHPSSQPEMESVLVAKEKLDGVRAFERTVVLLRCGTQHPQEGSFGVLLNCSLHKKIKHMKSNNLELATTFADCSLHFGGPLEASMFLLRTGKMPKLPGFEEVIPGLRFGGRNNLDEAMGLVKKGVLKPQDFQFFVDMLGGN